MHPSDNKLPQDLQDYHRTTNNSQGYNQIVQKLIDGEYVLFLPTQNDGKADNQWKTLAQGSELKLKSVFNLDGLKVLAAFSSELALSEWSQNPSTFSAMSSDDLLSLCESNGIDRIVIDSKLPTMFVLERSRNGVQTDTVQQATTVSIRPISQAINVRFIQALSKHAHAVTSIDEIYQFEMERNDEEILTLGFKLNVYSDNSRQACIHAIQNSLEGDKFHLPLELFFLDDQNWYGAVSKIPGSLLWRR